MNKFKIGDKVARLPSEMTGEFIARCQKAGLLPSGVFVVEDLHPAWIKVVGLDYSWDLTKFTLVNNTTSDSLNQAVVAPSHYQFFPDLEAIEVIASTLTLAEFRGYCLGNRLKYRLRAGKKDKLEQDIQKSDFYVELYEKHRNLCKDYIHAYRL